MAKIQLLMTIALLSLFMANSAFAQESQNIVIFCDSLSDSGYTSTFHNIDKDWPKIPADPKKVKQATYSSPNEGDTV